MTSASTRGAYRSTDTCVSCGRTIDARAAAYTGDGMICPECEAGEMIRQADVESAGASGMGAIAWGALSLVCNPFFIPSILAITGGVKELQTLGLVDHERRANQQIKAIFAIILGAAWPVLFVGVFGLALMWSVVDAATDRHYGQDPSESGFYADEEWPPPPP